ncbi:MAG: hypothetical protein LBB36_01925 [Fibromonadaceae bacterium]|jgi:hypothetical protein|nr:hypothetical protein [Fibromonadaceae bacterium]
MKISKIHNNNRRNSMKKAKHALLTALMLALSCQLAFSQCINTEEQFSQKAREMQEQCNKIIAMVPCAVDYKNDYPFQDKVMSLADDAALVALAKGVEAFIKYHSKDSIYMEDDIAKRLEENVSKVNVRQRLANTRSIERVCGKFDKNGKTLYYGASLRVLDPELYKEALAEIKKIEEQETVSVSSSSQVALAVVSSSSVAVPAPQANAAKQNATAIPQINLPKKSTSQENVKKIVTAAGKILLRVFGL